MKIGILPAKSDIGFFYFAHAPLHAFKFCGIGCVLHSI